ncbi:MAG TPA: glycoside hydrolase family 19 protein [Polyangiaceae bacterium]|nr:glycoside hydrolase family 19 protein [Polyangiaceae bacterium]
MSALAGAISCTSGIAPSGPGDANGASGNTSSNSSGGSGNPGAGAQNSSGGTSFAGSSTGMPGGGSNPTSGGSGPLASGGMSAGGVSAGGSGPAPIVCQPEQNRCDCHTSVGLAINQWIDTFEDGTLYIQQIDERNGEWFALPAGKAGPMSVVDTSGGAPGSTKALHMSGSAIAPSWPTYGVPLGICYDASAFDGISFWIKGDSSGGKNDTIKLSLPTPPTTEKVAGGSCPDGDPGCYNHFATLITLSPTWTQYSFKWSQFAQANWGPTGVNGMAPPGYQFQKQILGIDYAPNDNTKAYDFTIDDLQLGAGAVTGHCGDLITKAQFESFFPGHNAVYTYEGFVQAASQWPLFCGEGDADAKKREVAAFFAHMVQETAGLKYTDELNPPSDYCDASRTEFPCGGRSYHGRGPLQISWNYNYGTAGQALGLSLLTQPELVVASSVNSFNAALWWWMTRQPLDSAHSTIVSGKGFGATIQLINGALECGGKSPTAVQTRVNAFNNFCSQLGVSPGDNESC